MCIRDRIMEARVNLQIAAKVVSTMVITGSAICFIARTNRSGLLANSVSINIKPVFSAEKFVPMGKRPDVYKRQAQKAALPGTCPAQNKINPSSHG